MCSLFTFTYEPDSRVNFKVYGHTCKKITVTWSIISLLIGAAPKGEKICFLFVVTKLFSTSPVKTFLFFKSIFCDPSLEPSQQDSSNEVSQHRSSLRNKKKNLKLSLLALILWSSDFL